MVTIGTDDAHSSFILKGGLDDILNNKRLKLSLNRLNYSIITDGISVPFIKANEMEVLQEVILLLNKFGITHFIDSSLKEDSANYQREEQLFDLFSKKAYQIRNNQFSTQQELVEDYKTFQKAIEQKMVRVPYPFQLLSSFHMAFSQNACNFSVPGAGKTTIVYAAYAFLKALPTDNPKHVEKLLIIGPLSSFAPWENEYYECFGKETHSTRISGDIALTRDQKQQHFFSDNSSELTLIHHGGVAAYKSEILYFLRRNKVMVVVDEAHRIKNPDGLWGKSITDISKEATSRIILTGTPVPNGYEDLFNLFKFIYPYRYKSILGFHFNNLKELTHSDDSIINRQRIETLKNNLAPYFIRTKKKDLKLPPTQEEVLTVDMSPNQRTIYDYIEDNYVESFKRSPSANIKDILNRAKLIRLRQAATNPSLLQRPIIESLEQGVDGYDADPNIDVALYGDVEQHDYTIMQLIQSYGSSEVPSKFGKILELVTKICGANEKVLIWTIFIQNAKQLQTFLKSEGFASKLLIGEVPQEERESIIFHFNNPTDDSIKIVIANPFSVAESISLHKGCHNAIYLERDYNASNFIQSKDRIHRVGLPDGIITHYYYIVADNSIDSIINSRLDEKVRRMENLINDDIPLFIRLSDMDQTDIISDLIKKYANRP